MSLLNSYNKKIITDFQGLETLPEESDVSTSGALQAQNVEFAPGRVGSRLGWIEFLDTKLVITSMVNWINAGFSRLVLAINSVVKSKDLSTGVDTTLFTPTGGTGTFYGTITACCGSRSYIASYNTIQTGYTEGRVVQDEVAALPCDKIAIGPISATLATANANPGLITEGDHLIGFILVSRSGFIGKFCPVNVVTGAFEPVTYTAPGGADVQVTVTPAANWAADSMQIKAIMTTASNHGRFYLVPSSAGTVSTGTIPGFATPLTLSFSISDDDLIASATDATGYQSWFTQDSSGKMEAFYPHYVLPYGDRMVWIGEYEAVANGTRTSVAFVSEPSNHQAFSIDQHMITIPGNKRILSGFVDNQTLYLVGPYWTYAVSDNGDVPVTWAAPRLVDGAIGSPAVAGVCSNSSQGFTWVASEKGLYLFAGGSYSTLPVSYLQSPTWDTIDWTVPYMLRVVDNPADRQVRVTSRVVTAAGVTQFDVFTWDYTNGTSPAKVKFSLDSVSSDPLDIKAIALVQNPVSKIQETWMAVSGGTYSVGKILRRANSTDSFPYIDIGAHESARFANPSIIYETSLYPGLNVSQGEVFSHHGAHLRMKGNSVVTLTPYGLDHTVYAADVAKSLLSHPGNEALVRFILNSESISYQFVLGMILRGVANTSGSTVTRTSGNSFNTAWLADTIIKLMTENATFTRAAGTLTNIVVNTNVGTVTTAGGSPHGKRIGDIVHVTGATTDTDLNGIYVVQSTAGASTLTINTSNVANATYTDATMTFGGVTVTSYSVTAVASTTSLTVGSTPGTLTGVRWWVEPWWSLSNLKHYWSRYMSSR